MKSSAPGALNPGAAQTIYSRSHQMDLSMITVRKTKIAILAATALTGAAATLTPAQAGDVDQAAYPAAIEAPAVAHAADPVDQQNQTPAKRFFLIALGAGALAGLIKLLGPSKILRAAGEGAAAAARVSGRAAASAGKAVFSVARKPLRFLGLSAGLGLFALTGVWIYDIEWLGGMIAGGALAGLSVYAALTLRAALRPAAPDCAVSETR